MLERLDKIEYLSIEKMNNKTSLVSYRLSRKNSRLQRVTIDNSELETLKEHLEETGFYRLPIEYGFPVSKREWINTKCIKLRQNKSVITIQSAGENGLINDIDLSATLIEKICKYNDELAKQLIECLAI